MINSTTNIRIIKKNLLRRIVPTASVLMTASLIYICNKTPKSDENPIRNDYINYNIIMKKTHLTYQYMQNLLFKYNFNKAVWNNYHSKKILHCKKIEKNESEEISNYDIDILENYVKNIEEKLDYLLAAKRNKIAFTNLVKSSENHILKRLVTEKIINDTLNYNSSPNNSYNNNFYLLEKLQRLIQPGIDNPSSNIPIIARDKTDYKLFKSIFVEFIKLNHNVDVLKNKAEKETFNLIKSFLLILDKEIITEKILEVDITTHRNINGFDFPSAISPLKRSELKEIIKTTIEELEPLVFKRIKNYELKTFENNESSNNINSNIIKNTNINKDTNINNQNQEIPLIHKGEEEIYIEKDDYSKGYFTLISKNPELRESYINKYLLLKSAGIFRDWPEDRLIYFNLEDNLLCLINEEDHLKIKLNCSDKEKLTDNLVLYFDFLEKLESSFSFAYENDIGYLTSSPNNTGASTFFNIKIKIPNNEENYSAIFKAMEESINDLDINIEKGDDYSVLRLSNKSPYYSFANLLIDIIKIKGFI